MKQNSLISILIIYFTLLVVVFGQQLSNQNNTDQSMVDQQKSTALLRSIWITSQKANDSLLKANESLVTAQISLEQATNASQFAAYTLAQQDSVNQFQQQMVDLANSSFIEISSPAKLINASIQAAMASFLQANASQTTPGQDLIDSFQALAIISQQAANESDTFVQAALVNDSNIQEEKKNITYAHPTNNQSIPIGTVLNQTVTALQQVATKTDYLANLTNTSLQSAQRYQTAATMANARQALIDADNARKYSNDVIGLMQQYIQDAQDKLDSALQTQSVGKQNLTDAQEKSQLAQLALLNAQKKLSLASNEAITAALLVTNAAQLSKKPAQMKKTQAPQQIIEKSTTKVDNSTATFDSTKAKSDKARCDLAGERFKAAAKTLSESCKGLGQ